MDDITFDAQKFLNGFVPKFKSSCIHHHMTREIPITKSSIRTFAKSRHEHGTKCILKIQTINKTKYTFSDFIAYVIDLSVEKWFEDLCRDLRTKDILTERGESIRGFDRDKIMEFEGFCYIHVRILTQTPIILQKYKPDYELHLKKWWNEMMSTLSRKFASILALHIKERDLGSTLNSGRIDMEFRNCIRNFLEPKEQYKEFGITSFEKMIHHHEHKYVSSDQLIEWIYDRVCIPLKFIITSSIQEIRNTITFINQEHAKRNFPLDVTTEELADFMRTRYVTPLMEHLFDLNYDIKCDLAQLKSVRQRHGKFNHFDQFQELYDSYVKTIVPHPIEHFHSNYSDPAAKALNDFQIPFHHTISCNPNIHSRYLETIMQSPQHSISTHFEPCQINNFPKNSIAISFVHPTQLNSESSLRGMHETIEKPKVDLFKNVDDKRFYLQFPDGFKYRLISPFTSHILDREDNWQRYDEYYDSQTNTSYLHLLE